MYTATTLNTILNTLPNSTYVYGFRLINGRDLIINSEGAKTTTPTTEPFTIDESTDTLTTKQLIQTPQGLQINLIHHLAISSIISILHYPIP
jgi:hypothetical protein